jgi:glycerol-3-phosphate acyltransferase PlsY
MAAVKITIAYAVFFLLGGIPFGPLIARLKKVDLSKVGSGNIGATNVYRALGMRYALLVFLLDGLKGAIPSLLGLVLFGPGYLAGISGLVAVLGHIFSPFLKFRGGKGVATGFGAMMVLAPLPSLISLSLWAAVLAITKIVSLSSLTAAIALPALVLLFSKTGWVFYTSLMMVALVFLSHYENILRLMRGTEKPVKKID